MKKYDPTKAVAKGVVYLNHEYPGWPNSISPISLDMASGVNHLLVQLHQKPLHLCPEFVKGNRWWLIEHGFLVPNEESEYEALTQAWFDVVYDAREGTQ